MTEHSPIWLQDLQVAMDRRYIDRLERAVDELRRLGWNCHCFKSPAGGPPAHISITLSRTLEAL